MSHHSFCGTQRYTTSEHCDMTHILVLYIQYITNTHALPLPISITYPLSPYTWRKPVTSHKQHSAPSARWQCGLTWRMWWRGCLPTASDVIAAAWYAIFSLFSYLLSHSKILSNQCCCPDCCSEGRLIVPLEGPQYSEGVWMTHNTFECIWMFQLQITRDSLLWKHKM